MKIHEVRSRAIGITFEEWIKLMVNIVGVNPSEKQLEKLKILHELSNSPLAKVMSEEEE